MLGLYEVLSYSESRGQLDNCPALLYLLALSVYLCHPLGHYSTSECTAECIRKEPESNISALRSGSVVVCLASSTA
jgi:hypothetical protein